MSSPSVRFCWWHTFSAHRTISRPRAKKKVQLCVFACVCESGTNTLTWKLSKGSSDEDGGVCQSFLALRVWGARSGAPLRWARLGVPAKVAASKASAMHNALEASFTDSPLCRLPLQQPPANQERHIRMSRHTHVHTQADAHTRRLKFTNQKVYFLEADSQEKSSWKKLE